MIESSGFEDAIAYLNRLGDGAKDAMAETLNEGAKAAREYGVKAISSQVALKPAYVRKHLQVKGKAKGSRLESIVAATARPVLLSRYGSRQEWQPGKTVARKRAGVSVQVKASGSRKTLKHGFFIRLKRQIENNAGAMGLAMRTGKGRDNYKVLHGPSVDQLWQGIRNEAVDMDAMLEQFWERLSRYE